MKVSPQWFPQTDRTYYILQFNGLVKAESKAELEKIGVEFFSYLPDDAFLVRIKDVRSFGKIKANKNVQTLLPFASEYRISSNFKPVSVFNRNVRARMVLKLVDEKELDSFLSTSNRKGVHFVLNKVTDKVLILDTAMGNIDTLAGIEGVEWIEPYPEFKPMNYVPEFENPQLLEENVAADGDYTDLNGYESGTKVMNLDAAYQRGFTGKGQRGAYADTGLDRGSQTDILDDIKGRIPKGYYFGLFAKSWEDPQGHGTHVAGSIVGNGAISSGKIVGAAYDSELIIEGLWSPMLNNISVNPNFDKLFGSVHRDDQAFVHSNSWGSAANLGEYDNFSSLADEVSFKNPDLLIVFAAGNSGEDGNNDGLVDEGSVSSPGTAKNVLTVGASENQTSLGGIQKQLKELRGKWKAEPIASDTLSNNPNGIAAFSSRGPTKDKRIKPEIVAPGTNILSLRSQQKDATTLWGAYNQFYAWAGGTSMATPLTSGAALVIRQYLVDGLKVNKPSAALLKAVLIHTAKDLYPGQFGEGVVGQELPTKRPNVHEGFGRVDADAATQLTAESLVDEKVGLKTTETKEYTLDAKAGQTLRASLVYTDAPAAANAAVALVNDLDLKVVGPNGEVSLPNHKTDADKVNNSEMIEVSVPADGQYVIRVTAANVPKGIPGTNSQPYGLVFTAQ